MARHVDSLVVLQRFLDEHAPRQRQRLPPERALAADLGLTRAQVRTGLRKLEEQGLISRHVGRGTFYGAPPDQADAAALDTLINPRELMEARLALEPRLARLAALQASRKDLDEIEAWLTRSVAAGDHFAFQHFDAGFHAAIADATRSTLLIALYAAINAPGHKAVWGRLKEKPLDPARQAEFTAQHQAIFAAIREREPDPAEAAMRAHLDTVYRHLFG